MSVSTRCPNCGAECYPVVLGPESAPWVCMICRTGWWVAELTRAARLAWRPEHRDFGYGMARAAIVAARDAEQAAARTRGTSTPLDQLARLPVAGLQRLAGIPAIADRVAAELTRKGG